MNNNPMLQDIFLNQIRRDAKPVRIKTLSGEVIDCIIKAFDGQSIIVEKENAQLLFYKNSIESINVAYLVLKNQ